MKSGWLIAIAAVVFLTLSITTCVLTKHIVDQNVQVGDLETNVACLQLEIDTISRTQLPTTFIVGQLPTSVEQCFRVGGWDYVVMTFNPGTRSEGFNSILAVNGNVVEPDDLINKTATVETPWGTMRWLGSFNDRKHAWVGSGWQLVETTYRGVSR